MDSRNRIAILHRPPLGILNGFQESDCYTPPPSPRDLEWIPGIVCGATPYTCSCRTLNHFPPGRALTDFHKREPYRKMRLVGRYSLGYPVSPAQAFHRCSILTAFHTHWLSRIPMVTLIDTEWWRGTGSAELAASSPRHTLTQVRWEVASGTRPHQISNRAGQRVRSSTWLAGGIGRGGTGYPWGPGLRHTLTKVGTTAPRHPCDQLGNAISTIRYYADMLTISISPGRWIEPRLGPLRFRFNSISPSRYRRMQWGRLPVCFGPVIRKTGARIKRRGERDIPDKTRGPTASSGAILTCENPVTRPRIEPVANLKEWGSAPHDRVSQTEMTQLIVHDGLGGVGGGGERNRRTPRKPAFDSLRNLGYDQPVEAYSTSHASPSTHLSTIKILESNHPSILMKRFRETLESRNLNIRAGNRSRVTPEREFGAISQHHLGQSSTISMPPRNSGGCFIDLAITYCPRFDDVGGGGRGWEGSRECGIAAWCAGRPDHRAPFGDRVVQTALAICKAELTCTNNTK
ncbi:hypothetical protein PR048_014313 [Dryococelus australis]|uniref:Uncharacterized protein n=1 Tax=Dryococelus australis TaxID=614101 RepID=A0ABQ9HE30_9NEOP|nr:hypothetical protein PR048_014313 [Dryococelus australis]